MTNVDAIADNVWDSLRGSLFSRAVLGRRRCTELVLNTLAAFPDRTFAERGVPTQNTLEEQRIVAEVTAKVAAKVMTSPVKCVPYSPDVVALVVRWATAAVVQMLVTAWWDRRLDVAAIRKEYGWP